jgi:type VI secretion system protein
MFKGRTLLERFHDPRTNEPLSITQNTETLAESILDHLKKMLNTRQGNSRTQPDDYGMIDITEVSSRFPESVRDVEKAIRVAIERYEPRLRNVQVEHVEVGENLLTLKFKITAQIVATRGRDAIAFETVVEPTGQVRLDG